MFHAILQEFCNLQLFLAIFPYLEEATQCPIWHKGKNGKQTKKLDKIKERLAKASEGDWDYEWCMYDGRIHPRGLMLIKTSKTDKDNKEPNTNPYDAALPNLFKMKKLGVLSCHQTVLCFNLWTHLPEPVGGSNHKRPSLAYNPTKRYTWGFPSLCSLSVAMSFWLSYRCSRQS